MRRRARCRPSGPRDSAAFPADRRNCGAWEITLYSRQRHGACFLDPESPRPDPSASRPPKGRRGRIVIALLAVLSFVGVAPLLTIALKLIDLNRESLTTAHQQYQLLLVSSIAREIDARVDALQKRSEQLARVLAPMLARGRPDEITGELSGAVSPEVPYLRYTYFRKNGLGRVDEGELDPLLEHLFEEGVARAAVDLVDLRAPGGIFSDPIVAGEPPRATLVISTPVVWHGSFLGVLSALVDVDSIWGAVTGPHRGQVIFALDPQGRMFATSDEERFGLRDDVQASPLVGRFLGGTGEARETLPFELKRDGVEERLLGSYELADHGWGIFVQAPLREVYLPIAAMRQSALKWAAGALLLAVAAAFFFARSWSEPIRRLAAASRAFAAQDFSIRVTTRQRNEIGDLAENFNQMASDIESYIERLHDAVKENEELFLGTIAALAQAIDAKDPYTRGHSTRVNRYSVKLAEELELPAQLVRDINVASLLHDVGKIGIHDEILQKPGRLTDEEFAIMKTHTVLGANIMKEIPKMDRIIPGLRHHHERCSGTGYPDGLAGETIPLMARIIAVADTFDAITTDRPYQRRMTEERAVARINELRGEALDGAVVDAFNRAWSAGRIRCGEGEPAGRDLALTPRPAPVTVG